MTVPHIDNVNLYLYYAAILVIFAVVVVLLILFIPHKKPKKIRTMKHGINRPIDRWTEQAEKIRSDYQVGSITENEAYAQLARLARSFASDRLGTDLSSNTLLDLNRRHQISSKEHFEVFKQTIAALYPPEFAKSDQNRAANEADVDTAADWVESLIGRWAA